MQLKILYCSSPGIFDPKNLDRSDRVYLDRQCHGMLEWVSLNFYEQEFDGLTWVRPRLSAFDYVFLGKPSLSLTSYKKIKALLGKNTLHVYLLKGHASTKDFTDAKSIFDHVEWVSNLNEERLFVGSQA